MTQKPMLRVEACARADLLFAETTGLTFSWVYFFVWPNALRLGLGLARLGGNFR